MTMAQIQKACDADLGNITQKNQYYMDLAKVSFLIPFYLPQRLINIVVSIKNAKIFILSLQEKQFGSRIRHLNKNLKVGKKIEYVTECYHVFIEGYRRDGRKENCSLIFNSGLEDCVDE